MALTRINNNSLSAVTAAGNLQLTSGNMPTGSVIQTVRAYTDALTDLNSSASTWQDVGFEAAITPSSASSDILITLSIVWRHTSVNADGNLRMKYSTDGKASSNVVNPSTNVQAGQSAAILGNTRGGDAEVYGYRINWTTVHSPATTNEVVYWVQYISEASIQMNRATTSAFPRFGCAVSEIILQEIAG